jgi:hypothetical protein
MFEMAMLLSTAAFKSFEGFEQAHAEKEALERRKEIEEIEATQEAVIRDKQLESTLHTQRAEGAARGIAPTSASLSAISQGTFDNFADDVQARNLNLQLKLNNINQAEENVSRTAKMAVFGNLFDAANRFNDMRVPQAPGKVSGNELDTATIAAKKFDVLGPLDLKTHNQERINEDIGF